MQPFEIRVPATESTAHDGRPLPELLLSVPTADDVDRITEICQDPEIRRWTTVPEPYAASDASFFVDHVVIDGWRDDTDLTWGIREVAEDGTSTYVGTVDLVLARARRGELGFMLAPAARGRGTLHRALNALLDVAFDPSGPLALPGVGWACLIDDGVPNWASWRVAWRLGFVKEGLRRAAFTQKGRVYDEWTAALLPGDPREPRAPWDGPTPASAAPTGRGNGSAHATGASTPLVAHDGVGEREGDDPEALVRRFHHVYGLPIQTDGPSLDRASLGMRMSLIAEEFGELVGSVYGADARAEVDAAFQRAVAADDGTRDTVETADALADLVYVIYGMALETGIDLAAVLAEVQRSNMSKLGEDGQPIYREDGKVLKGPGYFPPDVARVLREQRDAAARGDQA